AGPLELPQWDQSGSTKSMSEHLFCKHQLLNPGKVESGLQDIFSVMINKQKTNHNCKGITLNYLKKAITYLISNADLPFAFVGLGNLFFSRKTVAMEAHYFHNSHSHHIKNVFKNIKQIGFTLDVWTSPNTIAF
ncbi:uncharacterized protein VP01_12434g1, partial [Puccinia sorghi]